MLDTLRRIIQEVNAARSVEQALEIIVRRVKEAIQVDVCSIYLADEERHNLILMATEGLDEESVGSVHLAWQEGLVGLVAERAEPVNLDDAPSHPRFRYFPETGEERYHAFLGVPVIHHRKVLGVLVVQQHAESRFDEDTVTFLITVAAQLAGAIAHAAASGGIDGLLRQDRIDDSRFLQGLPGAPGVAIGTVVVVQNDTDVESVPDREAEDPEAEKRRFLDAVAAVRDEVRAMIDRLEGVILSGDSALFDAYLLMLESDSFTGGTVERIEAGSWAPAALRETVREHARVFDDMDDPYLRERAQDVRDLGRRVLQRMQQAAPEPIHYPQDCILVGEEITASMLAEAPPEQLAGVVSVRGSRTSHTAILARALGIPAVMGAHDLPVGRIDGCAIIADGYNGRVYVNPSEAISLEYIRLQREEQELSAGLSGLREESAQTPDGVRIPLLANTGLISDIRPSLASGAEGVGLYRTEFPFMIRDRFPGEEEQCAVYRQVLEAFHPRPVVMRTLDVGGDKALPYFPIEEDNPFLGWRGIRITLDHPEIFLVQIRAMLRAAVGLGNLQLLLPMISNVGEVDEALVLMRRAHQELVEEGEGVGVAVPPVGVMIEVPSAVFHAGRIARRVDFLSIGTNDLTQYLLAVDRNNARVADLYDSLNPAVLHAVKQVVDEGHANHCPVSVCGEMAGDPAAVLLLLGMEIDSLSMSASSLLRIKWVVRSFRKTEAEALLAEALACENAVEVRTLLETALERAGLGGLVRAGK